MPAPLDCPRIECWLALLEDTLPPDQRERCERHLESCPVCQERLDRAQACGDPLLRLVRQVGDPTLAALDPTLAEFLERLHETAPSRAALAEPADLYFLHPPDRPGLLGTLGHYEVQEVIGQGGMGVVLKAFDPTLHRLVAIKVMAAAVAGSAVARRRFSREAQAAAAVCHDHIVTVHGVHEEDGLPYLVMQYVPGESLQARLDRTGPLELVEIVRIGLQTASGLAAAHAQGLIHRDIKPANLLLENGLARVKITDFGLARMADETPLTQCGVVSGTPEYMAPEQARGEVIDHRADLFSLGSVLYALCTGLPPFRGSTAVAVLRQVSDHVPKPVRSLNVDVPAWLEALVARLMAKNPAERFQSAAEVAAHLEGYLAHLRQPVTVPAPTLPPAPSDPSRGSPEGTPRTATGNGFAPSLWLAGIGLLLLGLGLPFWLAGGTGKTDSDGETYQEFSQRFEGDTKLNPGLRLFGIQAEKFARLEPAGLQINLPAGYPGQRPGVGLATGFGLQGDFEITVGFEILNEERTPENQSKFTGLSLEVIPQKPAEFDPEQWLKPSQNKASLWRNLGPNNNPHFMAYAPQWDGAAAQDEVGARPVRPSQAREGRLRLARTGAVLSYLVAEGASAEFILLHSDSFGRKDVNHVRVVATTSGVSAALTVRVKDLHIRAQAFGKVPAAIQKKAWWKPLVPFALILMVPLGAWLCVRLWRSRQLPTPVPAPDNPASPTPAPAPDKGAKTGAVAHPLTFSCPGCGKSLKSRAELAGKRVKCRHCAQAIQVPQASPEAIKPPTH